MAKYIDKSALIAEIKKRQAIWDGMDSDYCKGQRLAYSDVLSFLNTFETKEVQEEPVSEELEEEIQKTIHNHFFDLNGIAIAGTSVYATVDDMVYIAKHFANWQREQMMKEAIDGEVGYWNQRGLSILMKLPRELNDEDKCKVIIIKSE